MNHISLRQASLAATLGMLLVAAPALAFDSPPKSPDGTSSSSGGNASGGTSSGGSPTPIPEPAAIGLFALGIAGAYLIRRRNRKNPD